jgi:hypothetical protein
VARVRVIEWLDPLVLVKLELCVKVKVLPTLTCRVKSMGSDGVLPPNVVESLVE